MGVHGQRGQATIELIAVLPCVLLVAAVAWQLALAGHAVWMSAVAARAGARADAVGRDPGAAARSALPRSLERGLRVRRLPAGGVRVSVRLPLLVGGAVRVGAVSALGGRR